MMSPNEQNTKALKRRYEKAIEGIRSDTEVLQTKLQDLVPTDFTPAGMEKFRKERNKIERNIQKNRDTIEEFRSMLAEIDPLGTMDEIGIDLEKFIFHISGDKKFEYKGDEINNPLRAQNYYCWLFDLYETDPLATLVLKGPPGLKDFPEEADIFDSWVYMNNIHDEKTKNLALKNIGNDRYFKSQAAKWRYLVEIDRIYSKKKYY
jgi:hypothetical protein